MIMVNYLIGITWNSLWNIFSDQQVDLGVYLVDLTFFINQLL